MTKENLIPKTETVYELKNEVPSFEEFMKSYEYDEKVVSSYENEVGSCSNIEARKSFGPCNICYKETRWVNLKMACPAFGCSNTTITNWNHLSGCGSLLQISNKSCIRCSGCSLECSIREYPGLFCPDHCRGVYREISYDGLIKALNRAYMTYDSRERGVVKDILQHLFSHEW